MENIIYYIFLFILVLSIRFFKLKNELGSEFRKRWNEVFNVSLEIVYTASGLVIALILNVPKNWIAAVIIVYLVVVIFSALLEMSRDNFSSSWKTGLHIFIITIVIVATCISYSKVIPQVDINGHPNSDCPPVITKKKQYTIIIPYYDNSLTKHIGASRMGNANFYFEFNVESISKDSAGFIANNMLKDGNLIKPIFPSMNGKDISPVTNRMLIIEADSLRKFFWH